MSDEFEVESADSGAANYVPVQTSTMKKGSHIIIKNRPCKVDHISTSKPGKHGSAKCHIVAIDIFTGKKNEEISPAHATVHHPIVKRKEFALLSIDDGFLSLLDDVTNDTKDDIRVPENEIGEKIQVISASICLKNVTLSRLADNDSNLSNLLVYFI